MPKALQVLEYLLKSRIQFSDGSVDVDLDGHELVGFGIRATARGLRRRNGAISFIGSHVASLKGDMVRAAVRPESYFDDCLKEEIPIRPAIPLAVP